MKTKAEFLQTIFPEIPEGMSLGLWSLPSKISLWFADAAQAASAALPKDEDFYFMCGLRKAGFPSCERGESADVIAVPGLWHDIDVANPTRKAEKAYFPSSDKALEFLNNDIPLKPSLVVWSGGGLQPYWLFKELLIFADQKEHDACAALLKRWHSTVKAFAKERGFTFDSVFDLARVLRLVGTLNYKYSPAAKVEVISFSDVRYNPSDFEDYLIDDVYGEESSRIHVGGLALNSSRSYDPVKIDEFCKLDNDFKKIWEKKPLKSQDQSQSSYDFALAMWAVPCGFSDQDIADLIITHRRKHVNDPDKINKLYRLDYMQRTIGNARARSESRRSEQIVEEQQEQAKAEIVIELNHGAQNGGPDRERILSGLSKLFRIKITKIEKCMSDPPLYNLYTEDGRIELGDVRSILSQDLFRSRIAAVSNIIIPKIKKDWDVHAQALLSARVEIDIGAESTDEGRARTWITYYLRIKQTLPEAEDNFKDPFVKDDKLYIFAPELRKWIFSQFGETVSGKELGKCLRLIGCEPAQVWRRIGGQGENCYVWVIPETLSLGSLESSRVILENDSRAEDEQIH